MEDYFRTLINILLDHYIFTRDGDRRAAELLNLFIFKFRGEGFIRYISLIFISREDKKN